MNERGSVSIVAASLVSLGLVMAVAVGAVGSVLNARVSATTAADAAALAAAPATFPPLGLAAPEVEASRTAAANGAVMRGCLCGRDATWSPRTVTVTVEVLAEVPVLGPTAVIATSSAEFDPVALTGYRALDEGARCARSSGASTSTSCSSSWRS